MRPLGNDVLLGFRSDLHGLYLAEVEDHPLAVAPWCQKACPEEQLAGTEVREPVRQVPEGHGVEAEGDAARVSRFHRLPLMLQRQVQCRHAGGGGAQSRLVDPPGGQPELVEAFGRFGGGLLSQCVNPFETGW